MSKNLTPRINRIEPNLIIDGGMEIWPEGTSRTLTNGAGLYGSVLMKLYNLTSGISITNQRLANVPANSGLVFSNAVTKTAAGTLAAGTIIQYDYAVEGYDVNRIVNSDFSVIFFVKSTVASRRTVAVRNGTATHSFLQDYQINAANTWELKVVKFSALSTCPGTILRDNGVGMFLSFPVVNGSSAQNPTTNQWLTGSFTTTTGQDTTWLTGTTHDFSIAGLMVLPGDWTGLTASQYEFVRAGRNFQDELAMTQRYLKRLAHIPVTVANTNLFTMYLPFDIPMRTAPIIGITGGTQLNIQGTNAYNQTATPTFSQVASTDVGLLSNITGFNTGALPLGYALIAAVPINNSVVVTADARF